MFLRKRYLESESKNTQNYVAILRRGNPRESLTCYCYRKQTLDRRPVTIFLTFLRLRIRPSNSSDNTRVCGPHPGNRILQGTLVWMFSFMLLVLQELVGQIHFDQFLFCRTPMVSTHVSKSIRMSCFSCTSRQAQCPVLFAHCRVECERKLCYVQSHNHSQCDRTLVLKGLVLSGGCEEFLEALGANHKHRFHTEIELYFLLFLLSCSRGNLQVELILTGCKQVSRIGCVGSSVNRGNEDW